MDTARFDRMTRAVSLVLSRRGLAVATGLMALGIPGLVEAKKSKKKNKKLKKNAFGCVDVGGKCRGNSANCCSGICEGTKPKKGKKDKSRCDAHAGGGCQANEDSCAELVGIPCPENASAQCYRTTGKASFCGLVAEGVCVDCAKDTDCEALGFGDSAACVVCTGCPDTDTACFPPGVV